MPLNQNDSYKEKEYFMAGKKTATLPVSKSKLGYTTSNVYKSSLRKVWDAATKAEHLKKHFVDGMKGAFGPELDPVCWSWKEWGEMAFQVIKYEPEKEITFLVPGPDNEYLMTVRFEFLKKDGKTIFRVHNHGYKTKHLQHAFMMCEGWTEFHTGIKAYLKWGGDLRKL
jgi:uncharacterized protein YndB with AHSA1/START domain